MLLKILKDKKIGPIWFREGQTVEVTKERGHQLIKEGIGIDVETNKR